MKKYCMSCFHLLCMKLSICLVWLVWIRDERHVLFSNCLNLIHSSFCLLVLFELIHNLMQLFIYLIEFYWVCDAVLLWFFYIVEWHDLLWSAWFEAAFVKVDFLFGEVMIVEVKMFEINNEKQLWIHHSKIDVHTFVFLSIFVATIQYKLYSHNHDQTVFHFDADDIHLFFLLQEFKLICHHCIENHNVAFLSLKSVNCHHSHKIHGWNLKNLTGQQHALDVQCLLCLIQHYDCDVVLRLLWLFSVLMQ